MAILFAACISIQYHIYLSVVNRDSFYCKIDNTYLFVAMYVALYNCVWMHGQIASSPSTLLLY